MAIVTTLAGVTEKVTAAKIINRALRMLGVVGSDAPMSPEDVADGMLALNSMLGMWSNERLMVPHLSVDVVTLTGGKTAYTIGSGADIDTVRPMSISDDTFVRSAGVDYPVGVVTSQQYNSESSKALAADIPCSLWYLPSYPEGVITLFGVPSGGELHLWSVKPFTGFQQATTEVEFAPGYVDALAFNLAVNIAPEYEREATPTVKQKAIMGKKLIKRTNTVIPLLEFPADVLPWAVR